MVTVGAYPARDTLLVGGTINEFGKAATQDNVAITDGIAGLSGLDVDGRV
jgi:hypothetical protein